MTTGAVVWLTGLPAAGKSTLAIRLAARLRAAGRQPVVLDGDEVREAIVPAPGYHDAGRDGFYRTLAQTACLIARQGFVVIVAATAHRRVWRDLARRRAPRFIEVHIATPLEVCRARDPKGLYARMGTDPALPGGGAAYEPPLQAEITASASDDPTAIEAVIDRLRFTR